MARTFVGRKVATGMLLVAIGLLAPAGAGASTVATNAGVLTVSGGPGEVNQVTVEKAGAFFRVSDDTAVLTTSDPNCTGSGGHFSRCDAAGVTSISVLGKSLDDRLTIGASTPTPATLNGGAGGDTLLGGPVADTLIAGPGSLPGFPQDLLMGGGGGDTLHGSTDNFVSCNLQGGDGGDTLVGGPGSENMHGGAGPDSFAGGDGSDTVNYSDSGLSVTVTINNVANDGAAGENDNVRTDVETVNGSPNADDITGSPAADSLEGGDGADILRGGAGLDGLGGGNGDDTMNGGAGEDTMSGGFGNIGADVFTGGPGIDMASYNDHFDPLTPLSISINDVANDGAPAEGDNVRTDVEQVQSGPGPDTIAGSGQANTLIGGSGADTVNGGEGNDFVVGDFTFGGSPGADQLNGGPGDDVLNGGGAADELIGGDGFDGADYRQAFNPLTVTINDVPNDGGAGENDNVRSTVESVLGGQSTDSIVGNAGANVLFGGPAADTLNGAGGDDLLDGDGAGGSCCAGDILIGGTGTDGVSYASHFSQVTADPDDVADDGQFGENDNVRTTVENLFGGFSNDNLTGSTGPNVLDGGPSTFSDTDTLSGLNGADFLSGGVGSDTADGDAGNDRIRSRGDGVVDTDNCGPDTDTVEADSFDTLTGCENVFNAGALTPIGDSGLEDQWRISRQTLRRAERMVERAGR